MAFKDLDILLKTLESGDEQFNFVGPAPEDATKPWLTYQQFVGTLAKDMGSRQQDLIHMAVGISGEAGELLDAIKKYWAYNKPLDLENVIEELGDLEFYMQGMRLLVGVTRDQILEANYVKLQARYNGIYSDEAAQQRADKLQIVDPSKEEFQNPVPTSTAELTAEQIKAVDETMGFKATVPVNQLAETLVVDSYEDMPEWVKNAVAKYGPQPRTAVMAWNTGTTDRRASVLFAGEQAPRFFYKPQEQK